MRPHSNSQSLIQIYWLSVSFSVCESKNAPLKVGMKGKTMGYQVQIPTNNAINYRVISFISSKQAKMTGIHSHTLRGGARFTCHFPVETDFAHIQLDNTHSRGEDKLESHCTTVCTEKRYRNHYLSLLGGPLCVGGLSNIPSKWLSVLLYLGSTRVARPVVARLANLFKMYK